MNLRPNRKELPDINLTPLIDVVFLLLIFFMVSTTFDRESKIKVELPQATAAAQEEKEQERLDITVDIQGRYYVNQQEVINTDIETLKRAIEKAAGGRQDLPVFITADAKAPYQAVITVMDAAGQLGFVNMSLPIRQPAAEQ